jgi:hypothetical protein
MWTTSLLPTYPQPKRFLIMNTEGSVEEPAEKESASLKLIEER